MYDCGMTINTKRRPRHFTSAAAAFVTLHGLFDHLFPLYISPFVPFRMWRFSGVYTKSQNAVATVDIVWSDRRAM